ncbi:MAG: transporter [Candidatus Brocadia sp.]|nr:transporter [Candidatus Brocadia sp.]
MNIDTFMSTKCISITLAAFVSFTFFVTPVLASSLSDLITTLYGGKGIPVTKVFEKETGGGGVDVVTTVQVPLDSLNEIQNLNSELNTERGEFPVSSTGGGFTFQYDSELEVFTRTTDSLGPIFAERAPTLGKGKINFGFSYTYINFSTLDGRDLDNLESVVLLDKEQKDKNLLQMDFDVDVKCNLFSFYGTYGITDRWDISILIPVLQVQLDVNSTAKILNRTRKKSENGTLLGYSLGTGETMNDSVSGASTGIGDIFLRNKYFIFASKWIDFTTALDVKLQTGDDNDLLGTGRTSIKPFLIFSKNINHFTPHFNFGYEFNSGSEGEDRIVYTTGADYAFGKGNNHFSIAMDVIGSHKTERSDTGNDIVDFSTGFKWSPRSGMLVFFNVQTPLNDEGMRANWIPTVGYELNF